jgi:hypothetical protein
VLPYAGYEPHLGLQSSQTRPFETRENLTSVGDQKHEVDGFPSHFWPMTPRPVEVRRDQEAMPMGSGMDHDSGPPPVGVEYGGRNRWRHIYIQAKGPERVSTVYEDVSQAERLGGTTRLKGFVSRFAESIGQHWDRHVAQALSSFTHSVVRSKSPTKEVTCQRQKRPLAVLHKMGEHVAHPPALTPRRGVPRRLV